MERRELIKYTLVVAPAAFLGRAAAADAPKNTAPVPDARLTAPLTVPASGDIHVAFLIAPGAEVVDYAGPWGVFEYVLLGDDRRRPFKLYTVAASRDPVRTSGGLNVVPDYTFADAPMPDVVVVPAVGENVVPAGLEWLRSVQKDADVTMSVCNGSFVLAGAGLLDGKRAAAHHGGIGMLRAMYPKVTVVRGVRYVEDGKIATAGGLTSGIDLAMRVVERYFGRDVAKQTARYLEYQGTGWMHPESNAEFASKPVATAERAICPVCEMLVSRKTRLTWQYEGNSYYFCTDFCQKHFTATPVPFINAAKQG